MFKSTLALGLTAFALSAHAAPVELTVNGGFETGDDTGFTSFPTPSSTFEISSDFASSGNFGAEVFNNTAASSAVIQQLRIGEGFVVSGEQVQISFDARGETTNGGVVFAEFFSELASEGVSSTEILGNAPLALSSAFQTFTFTTLTGSDVGGGVTLQFAVVTGGDAGSTARVEVDNLSVTVERIPEPASLAILGLGATALLARRRRATA